MRARLSSTHQATTVFHHNSFPYETIHRCLSLDNWRDIMLLRKKGLIVIVAALFSFGVCELAAAQQGAGTGGATMVALPCGEPGPWHVAMDSENIYWTDFSGGKVFKAPVG